MGYLPSIASFPKWLTHPGAQNSIRIFHTGGNDPSLWTHELPARHIAGNWSFQK